MLWFFSYKTDIFSLFSFMSDFGLLNYRQFESCHVIIKMLEEHFLHLQSNYTRDRDRDGWPNLLKTRLVKRFIIINPLYRFKPIKIGHLLLIYTVFHDHIVMMVTKALTLCVHIYMLISIFILGYCEITLLIR